MHFSLIIISDSDDTDYEGIIDRAMDPFYEAWEDWDCRTVEMTDDDGETYWYNPDAKWDWYSWGGRWHGLIEATDGIHSHEEPWSDDDGHYDSALVSDVTSIDPDRVYSVLTPDGVWHDSKTFHEEMRSEDHPFGQFVSDETFKTRFKERFLYPYPHCRAFVIDYHI